MPIYMYNKVTWVPSSLLGYSGGLVFVCISFIQFALGSLLFRSEEFNATRVFTLDSRNNVSLFDSDHYNYP